MQRDRWRLQPRSSQNRKDEGGHCHSEQRILPKSMLLLLPLLLQTPLAEENALAGLQARLKDGILQKEEEQWLRQQWQDQPSFWAAALPNLGDFSLRAVATAASACPAESPLAAALLAQGRMRPLEATALPCLLAPLRAPLSALPALAEMSLDSTRPLSLRAAACARLLEAGCRPAWAVARSILRTGTAWDEDAPWATWQRDGRYELPKRILVMALDEILQQPCGFEPNAAWKKQCQQLASLEPRLPAALALAANAYRPAAPEFKNFQKQVAKLILQGRESARLAVALLVPHSRTLLRQALDHPEVAAESKRIISQTPH